MNTTELIIPTKETALQVFQTEKGLDPFLAHIKKEIDSFVPDISTKKGRDAIASMAYKISKSKTAIDDVGKDLVTELKELPKKVDAERKRVRDILDSWRDAVRKPLTEWEEKEAARINKHKSNIENIRCLLVEIDSIDSGTIKQRILSAEATIINKDTFEEFELDAIRCKNDVVLQLNEQLTKRIKYESDQAELARLRAEMQAKEQKEREDRIAKEAEEKAIKAAEEKARAEREAYARKELELKLQAEKAEREKLEAQQKAEIEKKQAIDREALLKEQAELERIKAIEDIKAKQAKEILEAENARIAREKDIQHRAEINNKALQAFLENGITEDCAKKVISLIAKKLIPHIEIYY